MKKRQKNVRSHLPSIVHSPKRRHYSIVSKLRREERSNESFERMISHLSLEEIIGLKLELALRAFTQPIFGFQIYNRLDKIVKEAVVRYAVTAARSGYDAAAFLGVTRAELSKLVSAFGADSLFHDEIVTRDKRYLIRDDDILENVKEYQRAANMS